MGMQKYRVDNRRPQGDGSVLCFADWMGGPSLSQIDNCRLDKMAGAMRRTVYITGEANTWFSIPAVCSISGCTVRGYVTVDDGGFHVFRHVYYR